jgi:hypothetical protein
MELLQNEFEKMEDYWQVCKKINLMYICIVIGNSFSYEIAQ